MKKVEEQAQLHDYKDCSLDFKDEYVHIVQKGVFESDVYYQNIESLTYHYSSQKITITQNNNEITVSTSNEKDYGPLAKFLMILGAILLTIGLGYAFIYKNYDEFFIGIFTDFANQPLMSIVAFLGGIVAGLIFLIIGTIMLSTRKQRPNFKTGYDELNERYHKKQDENVLLRKHELKHATEKATQIKLQQTVKPQVKQVEVTEESQPVQESEKQEEQQ